MSGQKPREIAARVLTQRAGGAFIEALLEESLAGAGLRPADRHLCQELVYGVVRWQATLDWLIGRKSDKRPQKPFLQNLLRLGLYQIFWLDRIPSHAAVNETVESAKKNGFGAQTGFVNALLRGYVREFEPTKTLLAELKTKQPALGFSHPDFLAARWQARWGADNAAQLMTWNNTPPKTFARVNTLKTDASRLLPQWRKENVEYDFVRLPSLAETQLTGANAPLPLNELVFQLKGHPPLEKLPSFQQGFFYIQDPSTLLAVLELDPKPGETVLDLCAAPGGKLSFVAQLMHNDGRLLAYDTSPARLGLLQENCSRLGITCVQLAAPGQSPSGSWQLEIKSSAAGPLQIPPAFDRVLIDAPCSNTGVVRRRVDLRWRIRPEEIQRLRATQLELLRQAAPLLKHGGTVVYSTCSLEPEENQQVVKEFLDGASMFNLVRERELLPFRDALDGAYVARLVKQ